MRRSNDTIVFGSQDVTAAPAEASAAAPWADRPARSTRGGGAALNRAVGGDLLPDRDAYVVPTSDRGLAFAAVSLALVGVTAAGTFFLLGRESARPDAPVATTTVTGAELAAPADPASASASSSEGVASAVATPTTATAPTATMEDAPWEPPVVDAVKAPNLPRRIEGAPPMRAAARAPAASQREEVRAPAVPPVDEAALERAGFYRFGAAAPDPATNALAGPAPAPSPPTTPSTEMVPPLTTPRVIDGPAQTTLPARDDEAAPAPAPPAPTDTLPEVQIKR